MAAVADAVRASGHFYLFNTAPFYDIPDGDTVFRPVDYANRLMNALYDYADANRIWIS